MPFNLKEKESRMSLEAKTKAIEARLEEIYKDYKSLEGSLESNLDSARINKEPKDTIGVCLTERHSGTNDSVVEKKLDTEKSMFSKHRQNISGNVPKLEEKRLREKPVEKEKYQSANK